ncbi:hypothetical protein BUZ94_03840 [Mammaliicoccus sciuri]|uniref:acyltransferase n=1 Tax=Mammaliicoccus sciuri TaxID=1296 RepID=UPI000E6870C1|nr:hypothetical protein [Mammaliicoccus sciuri]RIO10855.1 hypothetical protein BUZ94_03840 [Mammaliicoccus sciuri]
MRILNMFKYHLYPNVVNGILYIFPNAKITNKIRGYLLKSLFKECGENFQIASGVIINMHRNISIGKNVYIAHNVWINGTGGIKISDNVIISPNVIIATTKHERINNAISNYKSSQKSIEIGNGTWIAGNSTLTMGSNIGSGCVVSANSLVNKNFNLSNKLIGGVPAKIIKDIDY